jgi:hypothetical protein
MKSGEGDIPFRVAAGPDRTVQAARVVSYLEFLLRSIARPHHAAAGPIPDCFRPRSAELEVHTFRRRFLWQTEKE